MIEPPRRQDSFQYPLEGCAKEMLRTEELAVDCEELKKIQMAMYCNMLFLFIIYMFPESVEGGRLEVCQLNC